MATGFYAPMARSPVTELSAGISNVDTSIGVVDASVLPTAPNVATIGTGNNSETIKYAGKSGNTLTGCTRGFDPTGSAKAWDEGTQVARVLTAQDISVLQGHAQAVTGAEHGAVSADTENMIVRRDANGRARVKAPSHNDDIARKADVDAMVPLAGGTMTGKLYPQNNTDYTTGQARRIILSTDDPSGGGNGDVWLKYEA